MVTERVRTLRTEPMEGEIVKSHSLLSFINIGQRGRKENITSTALHKAGNLKQNIKHDVHCQQK